LDDNSVGRRAGHQAAAGNDGNVVKFHERKGKEQNAGDTVFIGWLSDRLVVPQVSTPKAQSAASRSAMMSTPKEAKSTASAERAADRVEQQLISACWGQHGDDNEVCWQTQG
jgi:hypothetical protein